jgi:hypothetical protein
MPYLPPRRARSTLPLTATFRTRAMSLEFEEDPQLSAAEFLDLVQRVWPGEYSLEHTQSALLATRNFTARDQGRLIGCVRLLSDGYFFGTIPEILVDPVYQCVFRSSRPVSPKEVVHPIR